MIYRMQGPRNEPQESVVPALKLADCWAKTVVHPDGLRGPGQNVLTHGYIAGLVARELLQRMPTWLSASLFPQGSELLAALHDIGKISPGFQQKLTEAVDKKYLPSTRPLELCGSDWDGLAGGHQAISQATFSASNPSYAKVVGRHHGSPPQTNITENHEFCGGEKWQEIRQEFMAAMQKRLKVETVNIETDIQADLLSGLTCVSDWIASGPIFDHENINTPGLEAKISQAIAQAGFIRPRLKPDLSFSDIFPGYVPNAIQSQMLQAAQEPGVYILEAPMGLGKTEAALATAYQMLAANKAVGIYFALPTQLTSDRILDRMNAFLERILEPDCIHRHSLLLHGAAWLQQTVMGAEGEPGESWFDSRKRGLLAPFAVGTIDQALMAAMKVKHGFVRTFGLAGKVVILDEVHSYDSYTGTIIEELVAVLRQLRCTVIILSATLTSHRRATLIEGVSPQPNIAYPLITAAPANAPPIEYPLESDSEMEVALSILENDAPAIEATVERASLGEQVLWIENTVADAQNTYRLLAARAPSHVSCGLLHSRYLKKDRWDKEEKWVQLYGKNAGKKRQESGRILVGTQVLEQSLDIDADFLVTRLPPLDMLFQRAGRLWRHRQNDPLRPPRAQPAVWVLAPPLSAALEDREIFGKTARVYSPYVLCRTLEVLQKHPDSPMRIPGDIRPHLEAVYAERPEKGHWLSYHQELKNLRDKLRRLALHTLSRDESPPREENASTRYGEIETVETLLIHSMEKRREAVEVRLLDGTSLTLNTTPRARHDRAWRQTAARLRHNTLMLPEYLAPKTHLEQIQWLRNYVWLGDRDKCFFRVAKVAADGELRDLADQAPHEKFSLFYSPNIGYDARDR